MASYLRLNRAKLKYNYKYLNKLCSQHNIEWGIVTKLLCGNATFLKEVMNFKHKQICDSRVGNLKIIKSYNPKIETVYIRPPSQSSIKNIIKYADISLNTSLKTLSLLSKEACLQNKLHKVIIMIEMGDLREGVMEEKLSSFFEQAKDLKNIDIVGIGANFNCLHGVMPSQIKLNKLLNYKNILEKKYACKINKVSGGATVTIPLLINEQVPKGINHFRIGEALFCGTNLFNGKVLLSMKSKLFQLTSQIIELIEKPYKPNGPLKKNPSGEKIEIDSKNKNKKSQKAIIDIGLLDISPKYLKPVDRKINIIGASSDMLVLDLGTNKKGYKIGDNITFDIEYMGILGAMNSEYITKEVV